MSVIDHRIYYKGGCQRRSAQIITLKTHESKDVQAEIELDGDEHISARSGNTGDNVSTKAG
jgi:hypothetical protein